MWTARIKFLMWRKCQKFVIQENGVPITYRAVIDLWRNDESFRSYFGQLLCDSPFERFRWETPPICQANIDRDFEFVLMRCDSLPVWGQPKSFAEHFDRAEPAQEVVTFENLGRNAVLVVPTPIGNNGGEVNYETYPQLAAFVRSAPQSQQHQFWQAVGAAMDARVNNVPVWLSTAGMGVSWLHIRLDNRPKYYSYMPYKKSPL